MLIFIHIPKTAGTSVIQSLKYHGAKVQHGHERAVSVRSSYDSKEWDNTIRATFIRNPWDRAVSLYYWWNCLKDFDLSFNDWIRNGCPTHHNDFDPIDQLAYITDENRMDLVNFIGHFENLENDTAKLAHKIHTRIAPIVQVQMSSRPNAPYQSLYDEDTIDMLAEHTRPLIERFGYTFA